MDYRLNFNKCHIFGTTLTDSTFIVTIIPQIKAAIMQHNYESLLMCFSQYLEFNGVYFLTAVIAIPMNELFVYPIFHRCLPYYKLMNKFIIGLLLRIAKYVTLMSLLTYARHHYIEENTELSYNATVTIPCLFQPASSGSLHNALDGKWFILPQILSSLSDVLIVISIFEHYCAQVPYSMKEQRWNFVIVQP